MAIENPTKNGALFSHRQPRITWANSTSSIAATLYAPCSHARTLAQDVVDAVTNMSTEQTPSEQELEDLIHKASILREKLHDATDLLESLDRMSERSTKRRGH